MRHPWPNQAPFQELILVPEDRQCEICGGPQRICDHRHHRFFTLQGPVHLVSKLCQCTDPDCPGHHFTVSPPEESSLTMPWWLIGWDVFAWIGHRRFARHWSVPQIRAELRDSYRVEISDDAIEGYIARYQAMVAARHQDPTQMAQAYQGVEDLILSIDGLQPEKGHETLYVVRELRLQRVWFAEALLSSAAGEVQRLLEQARQWAERLGLPVRLWISDKQEAFVSGIAQVFPGVPHRYCENHFLRDLAKPVLEADRQAKVAMRRKVRGLRNIEQDVLAEGAEKAETEGNGVVLDYCTAVRGVLNDDHGGPLQPPGVKMAEALGEIRSSLQRNLETKKGGPRPPACSDWRTPSTEASPKSKSNSKP
jgi:hypothetical protein